mgnify:CR=1 FL=1
MARQKKEAAAGKQDAADHDVNNPVRSAPFPGTGVPIAKPEFHDVRVHHAAYQKKEVGATAYATGDKIMFNQGQYQPGPTRDHATLAHEAAHVIQQTQGRVRPSPSR